MLKRLPLLSMRNTSLRVRAFENPILVIRAVSHPLIFSYRGGFTKPLLLAPLSLRWKRSSPAWDSKVTLELNRPECVRKMRSMSAGIVQMTSAPITVRVRRGIEVLNHPNSVIHLVMNSNSIFDRAFVEFFLSLYWKLFMWAQLAKVKSSLG